MASTRVAARPRPCVYCEAPTARRTTRDEAAHEGCELRALAAERYPQMLGPHGPRMVVGSAFYGRPRVGVLAGGAR